MKAVKLCCTVVLLLITGCSSQAPTIPLSRQLLADTQPRETYVWVGKGEAWRFVDGQWVRTPTGDYDFSVVQRRFQNSWVSVKNQIRRHPAYDLSAGPRAQTHWFHIQYEKPADGRVGFQLASTYGNGSGTIDTAFVRGVMEFQPGEISRFAPFSHFRITQHYHYSERRLEELVYLYKLAKDGREIPFVRIREVASMGTLSSHR